MSCNMSGYVEFRNAVFDSWDGTVNWWGVIDAGMILDQRYEMFGSLFGVRNRTDFVPIAPGRGLPEDVSDETRKAAEWERNHSHTWITWTELQNIDWDEVALDGLAHYSTGGGGGGGGGGITLDRDDPRRRAEETWVENGVTYKTVQITRRQALGADFELLIELMQPLVKRYGDDCVRLVVWFDN